MEKLRVDILNAYIGGDLRKKVLAYVDMIIGMGGSKSVCCGPLWADPTNGRVASISRIDKKFVNSVEAQLGFLKKEDKETFRCTIRKVYSQKQDITPGYDFMDRLDLVMAVANVCLQSDLAGEGSLLSALSDKTDEDNILVYNKVINGLIRQGYSLPQAKEAIERFLSS